MKNVTISDVAERAGVSKSTVSAVLNNRGTVKDSTRRRVQAAIQELNYRPTGAARRRFQSSDGKSIGFVIKEADNPYYAEALAGMQEVTLQQGYLTFVSSSEGLLDTEKRIVRELAAKDVNGMIITPILNDDTDLSHLFELRRNNVPFVLLEKIRGLQANLVDVDNVQASCDAVRHLIELGHERIVHFAGPEYSEHTQERADGVRRAFSESHLVFSSDIVIHAGDSFTDGYEHARAYFDAGGDLPTAVTCYNDLVALGVIKALRELDLRVPDDVSVIGFDDLTILDYYPISLTTVHVPKYEMGKRAAEILLREIESPSSHEAEKVFLDAELVVRATTAPPRS